MSGRVGILGIVLAVQLVLVGALLLRNPAADVGHGPLLDVDLDAVDRLELTDGDGNGAVLERVDGEWRLASGEPADAVRVAELLDRLAGLRATWPVATTAAAVERFEVSEQRHQRQVRLLQAGSVQADVYLGTSPGFQRVHARRAGDDAVYSVGLSNFQVPVSAGEWLDRTLLRPRGDITALARDGGWTLRRGDEGWLLDGAAADQDEAAALVRRFAELRVSGVLAQPRDDLTEQAAFQIDDGEGSYRLTVYADADGDRYAVRSDRRDGIFELAAYAAEQLLVDGERLAALVPD